MQNTAQYFPLFEQIASDLRTHGYSVCKNALAEPLCQTLLAEVLSMSPSHFHKAHIGRKSPHSNPSIRTDQICWIEGKTLAQQQWLDCMESLRRCLNQQLLLGLFSFESHFAHYAPGDFYKTHVDAFKGQANRILSVVAYLNHDWNVEHGGELVLYPDTQVEPDQPFIPLARISPHACTLVVFLSEGFPHEVLPAQADRYSIAGWFRVNGSDGRRSDPPA